MTELDRARRLLVEFKGDRYLFGAGVLPRAGQLVARAGNRAVLIRPSFSDSEPFVKALRDGITTAGVVLAGEIKGAAPNAPREDVFRIAAAIKKVAPDVIITFGGGSSIDAAKAAEVLDSLGGDIETYFGVGQVSAVLAKTGRTLRPHVAIMTAASSAAHLTKYANITDLSSGQKKLIVDEAVVPPFAVFDHEVTYAAPIALTADGALDGISHVTEVLYGAVGQPFYDRMERIAGTCLGLVVNYLPRAVQNPGDARARQALCLATDLGGYAIMIGGTSGPHLTSFSLVDILSHGRACGIMNPYYTVFFAPVIQKPLKLIGAIYKAAGLTSADIERLSGRDLGVAVAEAMFELGRRIGFPTRLGEVAGFSQAHVQRALTAAKNPQLKMKLENMPVPLTADRVDEYMGSVLDAAASGNLDLIKNV